MRGKQGSYENNMRMLTHSYLCVQLENTWFHFIVFSFITVKGTALFLPTQAGLHTSSLSLASKNSYFLVLEEGRTRLLPCYWIIWSWAAWLVSKCQKPPGLLHFSWLPPAHASVTNLFLSHGELLVSHFHSKRYIHCLQTLSTNLV